MDSDKNIAEYFKKCFFSVDGLWFLKTEDDASFEKALDIDAAVWEVLPKIQARTIKKLLGLKEDMISLQKALDFKLDAEGYHYEKTACNQKSFNVSIKNCPWVNHLEKSNRLELVPQIADKICHLEYSTFAKEFGDELIVRHEHKDCDKSHCCMFYFEIDKL